MRNEYLVVLDSEYLHDEYIRYATSLEDAIDIKQEWFDALSVSKDKSESIYITQIIEL